MTSHIEDTIYRAALAERERGRKSEDLRARAQEQRQSGMSVSADFTACIASILERWQRHGFDGRL